jgi:multiple sugar transport system permease protein
VRGGFEIQFQGLTNFRILFLGSQQSHVLGSLQPPTPLGWLVFIAGAGLVAFAYWRYLRGQHVRVLGLVLRAMGGLLLIGLLWLMVQSLFSQGGRPGTVLVTFIYAIVGTAGTYLLGLGLAVLTSQRLPAQRFFRVVFLLPLAITPVGIAYMFRMLTDTQRGPFAPLWGAAGLTDFAPLGDPWGARIAVMIGDIWQWTPFMFIVLLAALESRDMDVEEAGLVDGASRRQIFRHITLPALVPVSATVILIRMIEAFKIIDLPNILTTGGPGTATESLTLQSFIEWRTFNLGQSAAIAYTLLIIVTVVALAYATTVVRRAQASV